MGAVRVLEDVSASYYKCRRSLTGIYMYGGDIGIESSFLCSNHISKAQGTQRVVHFKCTVSLVRLRVVRQMAVSNVNFK